MANLQGLLAKLQIEGIELVNGGYLLNTRLEGTYCRFQFVVSHDNRISGLSKNRYYKLTESTQSMLRDKLKNYCRKYNYIVS